MKFTPEELAEMAAADAEIEKSFRLSIAEIKESRERDREAIFCGKSKEGKKIAAQQREYYEANREKIAAQQREYREANREQWNAYQREYRKRKKLEKESQPAYQSIPVCRLECDDPDYLKARNALVDFANSFHRVGECGKIERKCRDE